MKHGTAIDVKQPAKAKRRVPPKAKPRAGIVLDTSRQDAFLKLPLEERKRRIQSFIDHFAPAFAEYSSRDFLADRRREAEHDDD